MQAEEFIKAGDLQQALSALQAEVRRDPSKPKLRIFLFQLYSVLGQWDRAITQLNVAAETDPDAMLLAQVCRVALNCEALRSEVFAGQRMPLIFGEPAEWVVWMTQALALLTQGKPEAAAALRDRAFEAAPAIPGTIDGKEFAWIADADVRLGPMLEAVVKGNYYWIPFACIREIRIEAPTDLRNMVWTSCFLTWANGGEAVGLIPTRYCGSELDDDNRVKLARITDWKDAGSGYMLGRGQRMLTTDEADYSLLDTRKIVLRPEAAQPAAEVKAHE